ncbi:hypothetical protein [Brevibacterium aurantiacum]|uniref:Uncharacterized protein n=1 Tax=Brevibacterium aurantiacum TaxID=273384 RepID=A0A556C5C7_BREAU|nr:hypothetical protein [Brevibacterium aurantiacum]TSI12665.1 hypothetical protein FO013_19520 [Brevibacterium aurantiacum]
MNQDISPTGDDLRDTGQTIVTANDAVEANAGKIIRDTIGWLIESGQHFSADDIRAELEGNDLVARAMFKRPNLLPAIIGAASRKGLIEPIGIVKPTRPSRHSNRNLIWRATAQGRAAA